jgi:hypothetical protein
VSSRVSTIGRVYGPSTARRSCWVGSGKQTLLNGSCLGLARQTRSIWSSIPPHDNDDPRLNCHHLVRHSTFFSLFSCIHLCVTPFSVEGVGTCVSSPYSSDTSVKMQRSRDLTQTNLSGIAAGKGGSFPAKALPNSPLPPPLLSNNFIPATSASRPRDLWAVVSDDARAPPSTGADRYPRPDEDPLTAQPPTPHGDRALPPAGCRRSRRWRRGGPADLQSGAAARGAAGGVRALRHRPPPRCGIFLARKMHPTWLPFVTSCAVMCSSQGDFGWTLTGEEAGGGGETGERFSSLLFMILVGNCRRELCLEHISGENLDFASSSRRRFQGLLFCVWLGSTSLSKLDFALLDVRYPKS